MWDTESRNISDSLKMQTYISQLSADSNMHNLKDARTYSRACDTKYENRKTKRKP